MKGGRGSTKSSFVSVEIVWGIMHDPNANAVVIRKVGKTLRQSVYEQVLWACELFRPEDWKPGLSPLELTYLPTGGKIIFRGADEPRKLKSTKFKQGYCKYVWFEELEEFAGMEELRSVTQSLIRGGDRFAVFYSFNPPKSRGSWINKQVDTLCAGAAAADALVHHSTYLDVDRAWLGERFIIEAEYLREANPAAYAHEYLGEVTGSGGEIFGNLCLESISGEDIAAFDRVLEGVDWGFATDPFAWVRLHYDKARRTLYIFDEICRTGLSNRAAAEMILERGGGSVTADSAEPKSIAEFNELGVRTRKAVKGPGSLAYGMKFLTLEVARIVIDPTRCPHAAAEFGGYEYAVGENGIVCDAYPDKNNHTIDAVRYAMETYLSKEKRGGGVKFVKGI